MLYLDENYLQKYLSKTIINSIGESFYTLKGKYRMLLHKYGHLFYKYTNAIKSVSFRQYHFNCDFIKRLLDITGIGFPSSRMISKSSPILSKSQATVLHRAKILCMISSFVYHI